jgi:SAM-dependent methyltransferase
MSNETSRLISYEAAVEWLRLQPAYAQLVKDAYLEKDNVAAATRFAASEEFSAILGLLGLDKPVESAKTIIDVGCGNGIASYAFATLGHHVVALDPDLSADVGLQAVKKLVALLNRESQSGSITLTSAFAEKMPLKTASCDIVYARQALHHFSDLLTGIVECARVLKPGGTFLATREHVVSNEAQRLQFLAEHPLHLKHGGENAHSLEKYLESLRKAGLQVVRAYGPYDTVINHFPVSDAQVQAHIQAALTQRLGSITARFLMRFSAMEPLGRSLLTRHCQSPGRLYSFLCRKPAGDKG